MVKVWLAMTSPSHIFNEGKCMTKVRLSIAGMMISALAWAMPPANYIPVDATAVVTFHVPQESLFITGLEEFDEQEEFLLSLSPLPIADLLALSGVEPEMLGDGFTVVIPSEGESLTMVLLEGTFDADGVLAKMQESPDALEAVALACGKVPSGGIYFCSVPLQKRVEALLTGKEKAILPTSDFATLVNEKNDPHCFAMRALIKGTTLPENVSALKASLIEHTPGMVQLNMALYDKVTTSLMPFDINMPGAEAMLNRISEVSPACKSFLDYWVSVNQAKIKAAAAKNRRPLKRSMVNDSGLSQDGPSLYQCPDGCGGDDAHSEHTPMIIDGDDTLLPKHMSEGASR